MSNVLSTPASITTIVRFLNEALVMDPDAVQELIGLRVDCNERMALHDTIEVQKFEDGKYGLGTLGLINGMIPRDMGRVVAVLEDDKLQRFELQVPDPLK